LDFTKAQKRLSMKCDGKRKNASLCDSVCTLLACATLMTTRDGKGRGNARGMTTMMMKRERRRTMRRVVGVVAVAVRDRLRDFCFCLLFLVRLVTIGLLGCPSNRARRRRDDDDDDGASTE
jgi:hypothetical protein